MTDGCGAWAWPGARVALRTTLWSADGAMKFRFRRLDFRDRNEPGISCCTRCVLTFNVKTSEKHCPAMNRKSVARLAAVATCKPYQQRKILGSTFNIPGISFDSALAARLFATGEPPGAGPEARQQQRQGSIPSGTAAAAAGNPGIDPFVSVLNFSPKNPDFSPNPKPQ